MRRTALAVALLALVAVPVARASEDHPTSLEVQKELYCDDCQTTLADASSVSWTPAAIQPDPPDDRARATRRARSSRRSPRSTTGTWRCCRRSPQGNRPTLADLEGEVMCPVCNTTLDQSSSPAARQIEAFISARIAAGDSKNEIKDRLVAEYGPSILAAPPKKGFNLLAWLLPFVALFGGALVLGLLAWRWSHTREPGPSGRSAEPGARAASRRRARPLRRGLSLGRTDPRSLPRGRHLDHHALRPAARAGLPVGRVRDRGRPARDARSRAAGRAREPAVHPRLHGRLRRPRDRSGRDRRRPAFGPPTRARRPDPRRHRADVHRAPALAGAAPRPGPADGSAPAKLEHPARRSVRDLRGAVHRRGARLDPRARDHELGRSRGQCCSRSTRPGWDWPSCSPRSASRRRWAPSAGSATTTSRSGSPAA